MNSNLTFFLPDLIEEQRWQQRLRHYHKIQPEPRQLCKYSVMDHLVKRSFKLPLSLGRQVMRILCKKFEELTDVKKKEGHIEREEKISYARIGRMITLKKKGGMNR